MNSTNMRLSKRLAKVERHLLDAKHRGKLADCNRQEHTMILCSLEGSRAPEVGFKSLADVPCPCHGLRRLGLIRKIVFVDPDGTSASTEELDQLIANYEARVLEDDRNREKEEL
jgi:hypothetical protein